MKDAIKNEIRSRFETVVIPPFQGENKGVDDNIPDPWRGRTFKTYEERYPGRKQRKQREEKEKVQPDIPEPFLDLFRAAIRMTINPLPKFEQFERYQKALYRAKVMKMYYSAGSLGRLRCYLFVNSFEEESKFSSKKSFVECTIATILANEWINAGCKSELTHRVHKPLFSFD